MHVLWFCGGDMVGPVGLRHCYLVFSPFLFLFTMCSTENTVNDTAHKIEGTYCAYLHFFKWKRWMGKVTSGVILHHLCVAVAPFLSEENIIF